MRNHFHLFTHVKLVRWYHNSILEVSAAQDSSIPQNHGSSNNNSSSGLNSSSLVMDPSQNPSSLFDVHPGEYPVTILVSPPLNGNNYHSCAWSMKRAMIWKNKYRFLDGSIPVPDRFDPVNFNYDKTHFICPGKQGIMLGWSYECIVDLPPNVVPIGIGSNWVYKIKRKADGSIERFKARMAAKGYNQTKGIDYFDTFSLVAKLTIVRLLLALASINNWIVQQPDINNAFLHGELKADVYMEIPQGLSCEGTNKVWKWYERLSSLLIDLGFK